MAKFTSSYDLASVKECNNSLTSCTEVSELQSRATQASKVSTVPVASLSYSSTSSRSSRTALMLARGGKDPYASINQLPARAFNTHDFMTLYPCKVMLTLKGDNFENVADEKDLRHREITRTEGESQSSADYSSTTEDPAKTAVTSFNEESQDSSTSPVVVAMDVSIEDYIERSQRDFGFNATDFPLARIIYSIVGESKEFGTPVVVLQVCNIVRLLQWGSVKNKALKTEDLSSKHRKMFYFSCCKFSLICYINLTLISLAVLFHFKLMMDSVNFF